MSKEESRSSVFDEGLAPYKVWETSTLQIDDDE